MLSIIIVSFFLIHFFTWQKSTQFFEEYVLFQETFIDRDKAIATSHLSTMDRICYWTQCDISTYAKAHHLFRTHAAMIWSSEWFLERIYTMSWWVHPLQDLARIDDNQKGIHSWWNQSYEDFSQLSSSNNKLLAKYAQHNADTLKRIMNESSVLEVKDNEKQENGALTWSANSELVELTEQERNDLREYAEYIEQQQEKNKHNYNKWNRSYSFPQDLSVIWDLLSPGNPWDEWVKDW